MSLKRAIVRTKLLTERKKIYDSLQEIEDEGKFNRMMVYRACRGAIKDYKGYSWGYADE